MSNPFFPPLRTLSPRALRVALAASVVVAAIAVAVASVTLTASARSLHTLAAPKPLATSSLTAVPVGVYRDPATHALLPITCNRPAHLPFPSGRQDFH